jgi:hypothetical protein
VRFGPQIVTARNSRYTDTQYERYAGKMERFVREQLAEVRGSIGQGATSKKSEPC